jgi:hypothetical protein
MQIFVAHSNGLSVQVVDVRIDLLDPLLYRMGWEGPCRGESPIVELEVRTSSAFRSSQWIMPEERLSTERTSKALLLGNCTYEP